MILFREDWCKYRTTPHVHYETKNESFLILVKKLHDMGVKNCLFPLTLLNPALINVDPHDPNLDEQTKIAVGIECTQNFWYFIREVVRIKDAGGSDKGISYIANRGNIAASWLYLNHIDVFLIQPRQTGKSVSTDCIMLWLIYFATRRYDITLFTKGDLRAPNIRRLKAMRGLLPKYLIYKDKKDPDNSEWLGYAKFETTYKATIAQGNETAANNVGRGITTPTVHVDEGPFLSYVWITIPAALNATTEARASAERNGRPYGNIFTTTAGRKDSREGKYFFGILADAAIWDESFYDTLNQKDLAETIMTNSGSAAPSVNITLSHRQLGKTDEWLRQVIAQNKNDKESAERDFLNRWTSGSLTSPLSIALTEKITGSQREVVYNEITKNKYTIRWYISKEEIERNRTETHYVIGMDTSDATSTGDRITVVIRDIRNGGVMGVMNFRNTNLMRVNEMVADLLEAHTNSTFIPERNRAQGLIDHLLIELPRRGIDPFKRIYNTLVDQQTVRQAEFRELVNTPLGARRQEFYDSKRTNFGFWTGTQSRAMLYGTILQEAAKNSGYAVHDKELIDQILGLVSKNERVDHKSGEHDDLVIAWLLGYWFITGARHLDWYGIDTRKVMSMTERTQEYTLEEQAWMDHQMRLRDDLQGVITQLKEASNPMIISRLESQLSNIRSQIIDMGDNTMTLDQLLQETRDERTTRSRAARVASRGIQHAMGHRPQSRRNMFAGVGSFF